LSHCICRFNQFDIILLIPETSISVFQVSFLSGVPLPYILFVGTMGYLTTIRPTAVRSTKSPRFFGNEYEYAGNLECDAFQLGTRLSHYTV